MNTKQQQFFAIIFTVALSTSTILQAIGLVGLWSNLLGLPVVAIASIPMYVMGLLVGLLPDTVMVIADRNNSMPPLQRKAISYSSMGLSIGLSALTAYVFVALAFTPEFAMWGGVQWVSFASFLVVQVVILLAEWLTKDSTLTLWLDKGDDYEVTHLQALRDKAQALSNELNLNNEGLKLAEQFTTKLGQEVVIVGQNLERVGESLTTDLELLNSRLGVSFSELSAQISAQLQTLNGTVNGLKLTANDNRQPLRLTSGMSKAQRIETLQLLVALFEANAIHKGNLAQMLGVSTTTLSNDLAEILGENQ